MFLPELLVACMADARSAGICFACRAENDVCGRRFRNGQSMRLTVTGMTECFPACRSRGAVGGLLFVFCGLAGCMNPNFVRYPTWTTSFPHAENLAYQQQDPFPDPDIGPSLESSPRDYDRPRSLPRRAAEQRLFQGLPLGPEAVPPGAPQGGLQRRGALR